MMSRPISSLRLENLNIADRTIAGNLVHTRNHIQLLGLGIFSISLALSIAQRLNGQTMSPDAMTHWNAVRDAESRKQFDVAVIEYRKVTELEPKAPMGF